MLKLKFGLMFSISLSLEVKSAPNLSLLVKFIQVKCYLRKHPASYTQKFLWAHSARRHAAKLWNVDTSVLAAVTLMTSITNQQSVYNLAHASVKIVITYATEFVVRNAAHVL